MKSFRCESAAWRDKPQQAHSGRAGIWGARDEQDDQAYQLQR
jgi:hypothetical protein